MFSLHMLAVHALFLTSNCFGLEKIVVHGAKVCLINMHRFIYVLDMLLVDF